MRMCRWLIMAIVIIVGVSLITSPVEANREEDWEYIAHPGNIPLISNFTMPELTQGNSGPMELSLTNRYDMNITNVTVTSEIYRYANIGGSLHLSNMDSNPIFDSTRNQSISHNWTSISINETKSDLAFVIRSFQKTKVGTYFVRLQITFTYNGSNYFMRSRGHFTDEEWDNATSSGPIDIQSLGVDGIVPDTTFGVKKRSSSTNDDDFEFKFEYQIFVIIIAFLSISLWVWDRRERSKLGK